MNAPKSTVDQQTNTLKTSGQRKPRIMVLASLAPSLIYFRGEMLKKFVSLGCEVHAAGPEMPPETADELRSMSCVPHEVQLQRTGLNPVKDLMSLWRLYRLFRKVKPDVVMGYTIKPVIYGTLAAWLAGVKKRVALITGLGFAFCSDEKGKNGLIMKLARGLYKFAIKRANVVLFQNNDDRKLFEELRFLDQQKVGIVNGSGVDIEKFKPAPLPDSPVYLLIARLVLEKGLREYVQAAKIVRQELPESRFLLGGFLESGPSALPAEELEEWIESKQVEFLGKLSDVRPAIEQASVYVLPSYREGTPKTVLESMAMQRPIITCDAPGCRATVNEGDNGLLVPIKSVKELAEAMLKLGRDPELRSQMGKRGREIVEEKYDVHKVNQSIVDLLEI